MNVQQTLSCPDNPTAANERRPYLVLLRGGPIWSDDAIAFHARALSPEFDGEVWYSAGKDGDRMAGNFRLRCLGMAEHNARAHLTQFAPAVLKSLQSRRAELAGRDIVVVPYDPLLLGVIGAYIAQRIGAKLIVELSGGYGNPGNLAEIQDPWRRRLIDARNKMTGQAVFLRADGVRLLYEGQDTLFVHVPKSLKTNLFFDAIDVATFPADPEVQDDVVLFVGHPFRRKGVDVLLEAWARIEGEFPAWRLDLIGHELSHHIDLDNAARHRIMVHKAMPNAEVAGHIKRCGIFVLPSRGEGLPRALLEAGAAGRARISTRIDGIPRAISDERDGLLVEANDSAGLAVALKRLMADKALRVRFGQAAQAKVSAEFNAANYLRDMRAIVGAVLGRAV